MEHHAIVNPEGSTPAPPQPGASAPAESAAEARVRAGLQAACRALPLLRPGARLLLACSAGGDSMALLHLLAAANGAEAAELLGYLPPRGWRLGVVHFDHRQRAESAAEARFVAERACALGLPCFIARAPQAADPGAADPGAADLGAAAPLSEATMRALRHGAWARFARWCEAEAVVLAHQLDDQAETLLMRLLDASGPGGLAAMRPEQTLRLDGPHAGPLHIVRPLLGIARADLRVWLRARGLPWREDPSNEDCRFDRAWVRHELLPRLDRRLGRPAAPAVARSAALIREEAAALEQAAALLLAPLLRPAASPATQALDRRHPTWLAAGRELRRQLLRLWLATLAAAAHPPGLAVMDEALAFAERGRTHHELRTFGGWHLRRTRTVLVAFAPGVDAAARAAWVDPDRG